MYKHSAIDSIHLYSVALQDLQFHHIRRLCWCTRRCVFGKSFLGVRGGVLETRQVSSPRYVFFIVFFFFSTQIVTQWCIKIRTTSTWHPFQHWQTAMSVPKPTAAGSEWEVGVWDECGGKSTALYVSLFFFFFAALLVMSKPLQRQF
jgi:hypothetical protein